MVIHLSASHSLIERYRPRFGRPVSFSRAVGSTAFRALRFAPFEPFPYAVEVGATWLAASAQRTGINAEAKLLMFGHAFETWDAARVDLRTDARNERSRHAIRAVGARFEGVLRNWQPSLVQGEEGRYRDSAMFSVTAEEWPSTAALLRRRLAQRDPSAT